MTLTICKKKHDYKKKAVENYKKKMMDEYKDKRESYQHQINSFASSDSSRPGSKLGNLEKIEKMRAKEQAERDQEIQNRLKELQVKALERQASLLQLNNMKPNQSTTKMFKRQPSVIIGAPAQHAPLKDEIDKQFSKLVQEEEVDEQPLKSFKMNIENKED